MAAGPILSRSVITAEAPATRGCVSGPGQGLLYQEMTARLPCYFDARQCNSVGNARCVKHVHMPQNMAGHGYPTTPHRWLWLVPMCDKYLSAIR